MKRISEYGNFEFADGMIYDKEDVTNLIRLQSVLLKDRGVLATIEECANIWQTHSNDVSASWLFFPENDDTILSTIEGHYNFTNYEDYSK